MRGSVTTLLVVVALLVPATAGAATTEVGVKDFEFVPAVTPVTTGDAVHWSRQEGSLASHSVTANSGFFDSGAPTTGPIDLTVTFSAGTFRYYCKVHGTTSGGTDAGMNGFVKVPVTITPAPSGLPFTVRWATASSDTGSRYDVQFRAGSGGWQPWRSNATALKGVFGANGKPVAVKKGTAYSFRARSRTGAGPSGWSPRASFTA
jgi:plastocyanin